MSLPTTLATARWYFKVPVRLQATISFLGMSGAPPARTLGLLQSRAA
jgi:hypothetical protein